MPNLIWTIIWGCVSVKEDKLPVGCGFYDPVADVRSDFSRSGPVSPASFNVLRFDTRLVMQMTRLPCNGVGFDCSGDFVRSDGRTAAFGAIIR